MKQKRSNGLIIAIMTIIVIMVGAILVLSIGAGDFLNKEDKINVSSMNYDGYNDLNEIVQDAEIYEINYQNMSGAVNNASNYIYYTNVIDTDIIYLAEPTKERLGNNDYAFDGWYTNAELTDNAIKTQLRKSDFIAKPLYTNRYTITIYAKWIQYPVLEIEYVLNVDPSDSHSALGSNDSRNPLTISGKNTDLLLYAPTPPADTDSSSYTFEGWYNAYDEETGTYSEQVVRVRHDLLQNSAGKIALYARYTIEEFYTLKFVVPTDTPVTITAPEKYRIIINDGVPVMLRTEATGEIDLNDLHITKENKMYDETLILSKYEFGGWYSSSLYNNKVTTVNATAGSRTVYAKFTELPQGYFIEYDYGYGTNSSEYYTCNTSVALEEPEREPNGYIGYSFDSWYTQDPRELEDEAALNAKRVTNLTMDKNYTVYARWNTTIKLYSITYVLNEGVNHPLNPDEHSSDIELLAPTKAQTGENDEDDARRYTFEGWYTDSAFTNRIALVKAQNITVYAKFIAHPIYEVSLAYNGGHSLESVGNIEKIYYSVADGIAYLPDAEKDSTDIRIIYLFGGWYYGSDAADGTFTTDYLVGQLDDRITTYVTGNSLEITLYAQWTEKPDTYSVIYNLGVGEVNSKRNPDFTSKLNTGITLEPATKETITTSGNNVTIVSYEFLGWYTGKNGTGERYDEVSWTDGNLILWPKWGSPTTTTYNVNSPIKVNEFKQSSNSGKYVLFGRYPQTLKADNVSVSSTTNSNGFYVGSDNLEYEKVTKEGQDFYYRVEPILWQIIEETSTTYKLVCMSVLDKIDVANGEYFASNSNIYIDSNLDKFLSGGSNPTTYTGPVLYNLAFTDDQQAKLQTMTIDGQSRKISAVSKAEVNLLGAEISRTSSDYAEIRGAYRDPQTGCSAYWTRTAKTDAGVNSGDNALPTINFVGARDGIGYTLSNTSGVGIVPVIVVSK